MWGTRPRVRGGPRVLPDNSGARNPSWLTGYRGNKPVAQPVDGFDISRSLRIISHRFADLAHAIRERGIGHRNSRPDHPPEVVLADQLAGMLHQIPKHIEGLRRQ